MLPRVNRAHFLPLLSLVAACQASVQAEVNSGKKAGDEPEPPPSVVTTSRDATVMTTRIGVNHKLSLTNEASQQAKCRCLAAAVGAPTDPVFQWRGEPASVGDDAFVLAVSSEGTPCDWPRRGRGPSIMAVEEEGGNVIVTLEESRPGIPAARGAVVRRPGSAESWVIFRTESRLPYDTPLPGSGDPVCRVRLK